MLFTASQNDTFEQVAAIYTIGGKDYGPGIANMAGEFGQTNMTPGKVYEIPEGWLLPVWQGVGSQESGPVTITVPTGQSPIGKGIMSMSPTTLLLIGLGALALAMWSGSGKK